MLFLCTLYYKKWYKNCKNYLFFNMLILIWFQQYSSYPQTGRELSADITPVDVAIFLSKSSTRLEGEHGCTILLFWCGSKAILLCFLSSIHWYKFSFRIAFCSLHLAFPLSWLALWSSATNKQRNKNIKLNNNIPTACSCFHRVQL